MANLKVSTTFNPDTYASLSGALSTSLDNSPTAYTPYTTPTVTDLKNQQQLMDLQAQEETAQQAKLKQQVYGTAPTPQYDLNNPTPEKMGPLALGLQALATPLYAITGAIQAVTGTGKTQGLENVFNAVRTQQTSGDTLRNMGIKSPWIDIPLGFALDVALDPVNWLTAGTDATIPKLATGLFKGGGEGLAAAADSVARQKLSSLMNFLPLTPEETRGPLAGKAASAEDLFRNIVDKPTVAEQAIAQSNKLGPFEKWQQSGTPLAEWFKNTWKYDPKGQLAQSLAEGASAAEEKASGVLNAPIKQLLQELGGRMELGEPDAFTQQLLDLGKSEDLQDAKQSLTNATLNPPAPGEIANSTPADVQKGLEDTMKVVKTLGQESKDSMNETGWKWYDDLVKQINTSPVGHAIWNSFQVLHGIFQPSKVGLNYWTAYVNSYMAHAAMMGMFGFNMTDARLLQTILDVRNMTKGLGISEELAHAIPTASRDLAAGAGSAASFTGVTGLTQDMIDNSMLRTFSKNLSGATAASWGDWNSLQDLISKAKFNENFNPDQMQDTFNELKGMLTGKSEQAQAASKGVLGGISQVEQFQKQLATGIRSVKDIEPALNQMATFISHDTMQGPVGATLEQWADKGNNYQKFLANWVLGAQQNFNNTSTIYKGAAYFYSMAHGVSGPELLRISKYLGPMTADDITFANGFYHLSPQKALEAANLVGINYAAMPTAIKVLRNVPILGAPFASFGAGVVAKTFQTIVNNPGAINKLTFLRQEIARGEPQTPFEKAALGGPYYSYLNKFEQMKLPFFQDYPLYLNIARWLPYLSINFFDTPDRKYSDTWGGNVGQVIDQFPILKSPEGQAIYDYLIQPYILGEANPTGQFGQQLYPEQGTTLEKAGAIAQNIIGNFVPNLTPLVGFRYNQLVNAVHGKNAEGIATNEPASARFLQLAGSLAGVPITPLSLTDVSSSLKKVINPTTPKKTTKKTTP